MGLQVSHSLRYVVTPAELTVTPAKADALDSRLRGNDE